MIGGLAESKITGTTLVTGDKLSDRTEEISDGEINCELENGIIVNPYNPTETELGEKNSFWTEKKSG